MPQNRASRNSRVSQSIPGNKQLGHDTASPIRTADQLFPDGDALELIRDSDGRLALLHCHGRKAVVASRVEIRGQVFEPAHIEASILRSMPLPKGCTPYRSTSELFNGIAALIPQVTPVAESVATAITFIVFASWFVDLLPVAPILWIVVPPTASGDPLAQLLRLLCRRALSVGDFTAAGLRALPMDLKPTILTEVSKVTPQFLKVLRVSSRRNICLPSREKIIDPFCAKIIFSDQPLRDPAAAGFPLEIALAPSRGRVFPMNSTETEKIADEFQAKLLSYRLMNHRNIAVPRLDLGDFTAPTCAIAQSLAACVVDDVELQSRIVALLKPHDREIQVNRAALLEAILLEALLAACHGPFLATLPIMALAESVNTILKGRGESLEVTPEIVGWRLKALGFRTELIAGGRRGLALLDETRARIHDLAVASGVRTMRMGLIPGVCRLCDALQVVRGEAADPTRGRS